MIYILQHLGSGTPDPENRQIIGQFHLIFYISYIANLMHHAVSAFYIITTKEIQF